MDSFSIRKFQEADRDKLIPLMKEFEDYLVSIDSSSIIHYDPRSTEYSIDRMITDAKEHQGIVLIAEVEKTVVGFLEAHEYIQQEEETLEQGKHKQLELEEFFITEEHRGKGLGRAMMDEMYAFAKENEYERLRLAVHAGNTSAHNTYLKQGFKDFRIEMVKDL